MSAAPAYSYYPERAPERDPRSRVRVVPGQRQQQNPAALPSNVVFLVKVLAAVVLFVSLISFVRIGISTATVAVAMESSALSTQIDEAQSAGSDLEVLQSTLSNPTTLKQKAEDLGMITSESSVIIQMDEDVVVTDDSGSLSLSGSMSVAAGV